MINTAVAHAPVTWTLLRGPVSRFFDSAAVGWDQRVQPDSAEHLAPLVAALEHVEPDPERVLDIGTGTGAAALLVAQRFPRAEVIGIDLAPRMVAQANEKAAARGLKARFLVADIARFAAGEGFALVMMINMPPFFRRVSRLLRPGGHVICVASIGARTPFYTPASALERGFRRRGVFAVTAGTAGPGVFFVARRPTPMAGQHGRRPQ